MTNQNTQFFSIFPDFPRSPYVTDQNGIIQPEWFMALAVMFQSLQSNFKTEGIMVPKLSYTEIETIESDYSLYVGSTLPVGVEDISGQFVFDITNGIMKVFVISFDVDAIILSAKWKTLAYA